MNEVLVFSYYEIVNTVSETRSRVSGRYLTLDDAEEALKNCCDWYCRRGTGTINIVEFYRDSTSNRLSKTRRKVVQVF